VDLDTPDVFDLGLTPASHSIDGVTDRFFSDRLVSGGLGGRPVMRSFLDEIFLADVGESADLERFISLLSRLVCSGVRGSVLRPAGVERSSLLCTYSLLCALLNDG
jgi:hypothetical protein